MQTSVRLSFGATFNVKLSPQRFWPCFLVVCRVSKAAFVSRRCGVCVRGQKRYPGSAPYALLVGKSESDVSSGARGRVLVVAKEQCKRWKESLLRDDA